MLASRGRPRFLPPPLRGLVGAQLGAYLDGSFGA